MRASPEPSQRAGGIQRLRQLLHSVGLRVLFAASLSTASGSRFLCKPAAYLYLFTTSSMTAQTFAGLGVAPFLVRALGTMSIRSPTDVQKACIQPILAGRDCIGSAQTGSGKTIAFAVPILQELSKDPYGIFAVILTPTRELAFQIHEQFVALGSAINLKSAVIVGGLDMMEQAATLASRPHVIVATPGRLCDLLKSSSHGQWNLSKVKFLVLDEADRLLAPTFAEELGYIVLKIPPQRQTLLFTATITEAIMVLREKQPANGKEKPFLHLSDAQTTTPSTLIQKYIFIPSQVREIYAYYLLLHLCDLTGVEALVRPAKEEDSRKSRKRKSYHRRHQEGRTNDDEEDSSPRLPQTILFVSHCRTAAHLSLLLDELDIPNTALHSRLSQKERLASLQTFRASRVPLLIATDVGSRGLDIPEVEVVINWDVPRDPDDYVHRVGRTARAGKKGTTITFVTEADADLVQGVEKRTGSTMEEMTLPEEQVLEHQNKVVTAKRVALMELEEQKFGEKQKIRKQKAMLSKGEKPKRKKLGSKIDA